MNVGYNLAMTSEEIAEERRAIETQFRTMKFTEAMKEVKLSCATNCGMRINEDNLTVKSAEEIDSITKMDCYNRCVNIKLEQGPYIRDLGTPDDSRVPVLFLWPTGMNFTKEGPPKPHDHTFY